MGLVFKHHPYVLEINGTPPVLVMLQADIAKPV